MGERDYVLGTHDEEIARLGLQHRVWRPRALDAWRRAGIGAGQTVIDLGCGPGYAAFDLAEMVGAAGRVIAVDRSRRFLDWLDAERARRGLAQIVTHELDLDHDPLPSLAADAVWSRWVFAFVRKPRALLARAAEALRPGGVLISHEYFDYRTWRLTPRSPEFESFVAAVIDSWRGAGGEPDIALDLTRWLEELGFQLASLTPIVDVVTPASGIWPWPRAFFDVGLARLVDLGALSAGRAGAIRAAFLAAEAAPGTRMVTPAVLEIIARRRD